MRHNRTRERLLDIAFVCGVIALLSGLGALFSQPSELTIIAWVVCGTCAGMTITLCWGAYELRKPLGNEKPPEATLIA